MPCYDNRNDVKIVYKSGILPEHYELAIENTRKLEASLCAICNELDRRGIVESVLSDASRNGLIDLMQVYNQHKNDDISRIVDDIHKRYSKDELLIIKQVIDSQL